MKKIFVWMLTAIIALPSMSVSAQNVAKVGTTEYATTAEAMDAWKTNGGTLTLLADCSYESPLFSVTKKDTLNLNGHTLSWTSDATAAKAIAISGSGRLLITGNGAENSVLSFDCKKSGAHAIEAAAATNILYIENVKISAKASGGSGYVVSVNHASPKFSVTNAEIEMGDYMQRGVYMQGKAAGEKGVFSNVRIAYTGSVPASTIYAIYTKRPGTYENLIIDLSQVPADKRCYGLYIYSGSNSSQTISGENTSFTLNTKANSQAFDLTQAVVFTIESGKFTAPNMLDMSSSNLTTVAPKMKITGGKFSALLPYNAQLPAGKILQKGSDGYYTLTDGAYKCVIVGPSSSTPGYYEGFADASACWDKCSSDAQTYTIVRVLTTSDDITIPSGKYVRLQKTGKDVAMGTVTNNGNLILQGTNPAGAEAVWNNKIINNGTLTLSATGAGTSTYGDAFVLENNGGSVLFGNKSQFTAKALEQVKAYIPEGYSARLNGDYYLVMENDASFVATVGGVGYDNLKEALVASTKDNPAKLCKDLTIGNTTTGTVAHLSIPSKSENPHCYLDMNGHNIIADNSNDVYLLNNNGSYFTITGTGTIQAKGNDCGDNNCMIMLLGGYTDKEDVSVLEIGENVTIDNENYGYVIGLDDALGTSYGVRVDIAGKIKSSRSFASVTGNLTNTEGNVPVINILPTAEITVGDAGIYAAGYAQWNFAGKMTAESFGIEIRAGKLNMTGGSITCNATTPADDQFNGNGSTSQACAIAASQHSTKLPVSVVINGGELKAYTPIYQANPQNNPQEAIDKVSVVVNDAKVYSTSKNIVWSANKRVVLNGGVYNLSPAAYVAAGKAVVENTDSTTKDTYPYTIGDKATAMTTVVSGAWNDPLTWGADSIPTEATSVIIKHKVTIPMAVKARVSGITVEEGGITVEGTLIIGNDGIAGITDSTQLVVKDGAIMVISPVAPTDKSQPLATVYKSLNIKHKDTGTYTDGENPYLYAHIGVPTVGEPTVVCDMQLFGSQWNTLNGWEEVAEPAMAFKGYSISAETTPSSPVAFVGTWVGNQDAVLSMPYQGFQFVANSWTAPIKADEVLNQVNKIKNHGTVEAAIKVYIPEKGKYVDINKKTLALPSYAAWQNLAPLQAFFLYANEATTMTMNYEQTVWNALLAQPESAPQQTESEDEEVAALITLTAADGRSDEVLVYEGEAFHSTKMFNDISNTNIYVSAETAEYSTFGTENLDGTVLEILTNNQTDYTLSFTYTTGEPLCIKDMETNLIVAMTEGNTYSFSAPANTTVRRFIITRKDVPSHIENVTVDGVTGIYTITGQYLGENVDWSTLPQGIYLIDGQKYIK